LPVDLLDAPGSVLGDLAAAVRPQPGVVVDRVLGEVGGDEVGITGIQRLVVGADVVEVGDDGILTCRCRFSALVFVVRVKWR
jgi:hypothetical protein